MTAECCPPDPSHEAAARHPLAQEVNQLHAEICAGLAGPKRIMILYALAEGPSHVSALAALDLPQPLISRHLKVLRERGMVVAIRCGSMVQYRSGRRA